MVLLAIIFGHLMSLLTHVLLKGRVDNQLFGDGMARQLPGELVAEALLVVMVG
jgi:hypothetical protein